MNKLFPLSLITCLGIVGCIHTDIEPEVANKLVVHGHRGSRGTHPENTLPAFQEAVNSGAKVIEFDIQITGDQNLVISHDPDITDRLCSKGTHETFIAPIPIHKMNVAQIKEFDCGSRPQDTFPEQITVLNTPLITLDEFFEWAKKNVPKPIRFNIETKMKPASDDWVADPTQFAKALYDQLIKHEMKDRVIVQSFDFRTLTAIKELDKTIETSCLFESSRRFCRETHDAGAQWASPNYNYVTEREVRACHSLGIKVAPWTVNSESQWATMLFHGVDAIITDYPRKLVNYVKAIQADTKR